MAPLQVLAKHLWKHPQEYSKLLHTLGAAQTSTLSFTDPKEASQTPALKHRTLRH